jgi:aryl-alcohol dehydrogenase-like predicted oxidoreductase
VRAFNHLINTGQALYWGTSEWRADEITRAHAVAERLGLIAPLMEQPQYNMLVREKVENEYALLIKEYGMGLTTFSPMKAGVLTGKYVDGIPADSRLGASQDKWVKGVREGTDSEKWKGEMEIVRALGPVAKRLGTDRAGLALAWVLRNGAVSSAITGASRPEQLWRSVRALEVVERLTEEVMVEIEGILGNKPEEIVQRFYR